MKIKAEDNLKAAKITSQDFKEAVAFVNGLTEPGQMLDGKKVVPVSAQGLKRLWTAREEK